MDSDPLYIFYYSTLGWFISWLCIKYLNALISSTCRKAPYKTAIRKVLNLLDLFENIYYKMLVIYSYKNI